MANSRSISSEEEVPRTPSPTRIVFRRLSSTKSDLIPFEIECLKMVLKETVNKLIIANSGEKANIKPSKTKNPMKIRFIGSVREKLFHEDTLEPINEAMERMIFVKLGNDVARLRKILSDTINDLETTRDYQSLKILIDTEIRLEKEEFNLIEENLKSESMFTYLENRFDDDTKKMKAKVKNIDDYISEIESELNDLKVENKIKLKLVNKWEETRYSQVKFITDSKEKQLEIMTENYKKDSTRELRLKHEIETFLTHRTKHFEDLSVQWNAKYDKEVQQLEENREKTREKIVEIKLKSDELHELYIIRQEEIDEYLTQRNIKDAAVNLAERQWEAIVKIQSWWKGIMVRRGLGPYRRSKKNKSKAKAKKKKKVAPPE